MIPFYRTLLLAILAAIVLGTAIIGVMVIYQELMR